MFDQPGIAHAGGRSRAVVGALAWAAILAVAATAAAPAHGERPANLLFLIRNFLRP